MLLTNLVFARFSCRLTISCTQSKCSTSFVSDFSSNFRNFLKEAEISSGPVRSHQILFWQPAILLNFGYLRLHSTKVVPGLLDYVVLAPEDVVYLLHSCYLSASRIQIDLYMQLICLRSHIVLKDSDDGLTAPCLLDALVLTVSMSTSGNRSGRSVTSLPYVICNFSHLHSSFRTTGDCVLAQPSSSGPAKTSYSLQWSSTLKT